MIEPRGPSFKDRLVRAASRAAIAAIRALSDNKEWHFERWSNLVSARWGRLHGLTFFGAEMLNDLGDFIGRRIFFFGVWEPNISAVFQTELEPGDYVADIGANIGYDTLLASKLVGGSGKVIAVEPSTAIFACLTHNIAVNKANNVRTVNAAVSDRIEDITLYAEDGNLGRTSSIQRGNSRPAGIVKAVPLDEILTPEERRHLKLIKMDIEGGEIAVLEQLLGTLGLYPDALEILVEISEDESGRAETIFNEFLRRGFRAFAIENDYSIRSYIAAAPIVIPMQVFSFPSGHVDVLFKR